MIVEKASTPVTQGKEEQMDPPTTASTVLIDDAPTRARPPRPPPRRTDDDEPDTDGVDDDRVVDVPMPRFKDQVNDVPEHVRAADAVVCPETDESEEAPFADVRLLTHSILFENPQALEISSSATSEAASCCCEALPIDESVLTTGFAEDQFPAQATRRPAFVTVTVIKPMVEARLGVSLANDAASRSVYISKFTDQAELSRVLALSPLGVGDKLLTVNGISCAGLISKEVADLLRSFDGPVTIAVENVSGDPSLVETMVEKETPMSKVGLGLYCDFRDGGYLAVSKVSGLFANSFVEKGDRVVSVNGERVRSVEVARNRIAASPRFVSVTVESRTGVVLPLEETTNESSSTGYAEAQRHRGVNSARPTDAATCRCCVL